MEDPVEWEGTSSLDSEQNETVSFYDLMDNLLMWQTKWLKAKNRC